jgi:tubulin epsilon
MPESIFVQVGQCGNQIGSRFWDLALQEHASVNKTGLYDEAMSSFFRNPAKVGGKISMLKARAVLIDMEEKVLGQISRSNFSQLFDPDQYVRSVSGSGNNWAVGHHVRSR